MISCSLYAKVFRHVVNRALNLYFAGLDCDDVTKYKSKLVDKCQEGNNLAQL